MKYPLDHSGKIAGSEDYLAVRFGPSVQSHSGGGGGTVVTTGPV